MFKFPSEMENRLIDIALGHWDRLKMSVIYAKAFNDATDPLAQANVDSAVKERENINEALMAFAEGTFQMSSDGQNSDFN